MGGFVEHFLSWTKSYSTFLVPRKVEYDFTLMHVVILAQPGWVGDRFCYLSNFDTKSTKVFPWRKKKKKRHYEYSNSTLFPADKEYSTHFTLYFPANKDYSFSQLMTIHSSLCLCVKRVNATYGVILLIVLISTCFHFTIAPYFFFLNLFYPAVYGTNDFGFLMLQVFWIFTYFLQLLILIVPASQASQEVGIQYTQTI